MPYVKAVQRDLVDDEVNQMIRDIADRPGLLAYAVTRLSLGFVAETSALDVDGPRGPNFEDYAKAIGVLEAVKLELYRQRVAPYEDIKKDENGAVVA